MSRAVLGGGHLETKLMCTVPMLSNCSFRDTVSSMHAHQLR